MLQNLDMLTLAICIQFSDTLICIRVTPQNFEKDTQYNNNNWDNAQVPPQSMPEIPETHLYYTKVLLPP